MSQETNSNSNNDNEDSPENEDKSASSDGPRDPSRNERVLGIDQSRDKKGSSDPHDAYSGWASEDHMNEEYISAADAYSEDSENEQGTARSDVKASGENSQELEALRKELESTKEKYVRAVAETENIRKRNVRERQDTTKYAITSFARDLLDFADNFQRAMESVPEDIKEENERVKNMVEGIEAMERELLKMFEKHGITKLEPLNEKFDPNYHEVMFETPASDQPAGTIVQLIEPGYMIHDRLLRPARVGVAKDDGSQDQGTGSTGGQNIDEEF